MIIRLFLNLALLIVLAAHPALAAPPEITPVTPSPAAAPNGLSLNGGLLLPSASREAPADQSSNGGTMFVIQGEKCPSGSTPYKGPEQKLAAADHIQYCEFKPSAIVISAPPMLADKKLPEKIRADIQAHICPSSYEICKFADPKMVPDSDVVWCCLAKHTNPPAPPEP